MWVRGTFDYLHYYLSRDLLERVALENSVASSFRLQEAFFIKDLVVAQVTRSILSAVTHGEPLDRLALDQLATVLCAHRSPGVTALFAKRMGATTHAVDSSHVVMLSHPSIVVDVVRAATAAQRSSATA